MRSHKIVRQRQQGRRPGGHDCCEAAGLQLYCSARTYGPVAHKPEPTAENLSDLCKQVKKCEAAAGFAQDPDGDRLA